MERAAWIDERLDDLPGSIRDGFGRVDQDMRDLRSKMREMRGDINALRHLIIQVGGGMLIGFLSVLAAILVRGA